MQFLLNRIAKAERIDREKQREYRERERERERHTHTEGEKELRTKRIAIQELGC